MSIIASLLLALVATARAEEPPAAPQEEGVSYAQAKCYKEYPELTQSVDGLKLCLRANEAEMKLADAQVRIEELDRTAAFVLRILDEHRDRLEALEEGTSKRKHKK